jgi:N-acetylneuraminic acid mutarotase
VKDTLYVLGGRDDSGSLDSIERAQVKPDGTLGPFALDSVALVKKRRDHAAVVLGDELYVLGGRTDDDAPEPSIEVARIAPDGSLGSFEIVERSLPSARSGHTSVVIGNMLHVLGGLPSVERAQIASSSLLQFDPPEDSTATNRSGAATAVFGDALCVLGGFNGSTFADVVCASISTDGLFGEFTHTFSLAVPRARSASVVVGPWLYLFGGGHIYSGGPLTMFYDDVVRIARHDAGTFDEVHELARITARMGSVAVVVGSSVCVIGGYASNGSGIYLDTVECAAFAPN